MTRFRALQSALCVGAILALGTPAVHAKDFNADLGSITFPNAGSAAAQPAFLTGVKAFHSFEFEDAVEAFQAAQEADPSFAMAYWGEALSYNHPLWAERDRNSAIETLNKFAPTPEARAAKTPAGPRRGLMQAVDILYADGDKLERDIAYAEAMGALHETYPDDDEIATLYSVSLLGTVRPGDSGFRRQMQAGAIALNVFDRNPNHPGAAHFIIHAFDDPEHAILALPAARVYAEIAPDAAHALHMPSHIFVQLGMWEDVVKSNDASYKVALDHAVRKGIDRGRSEYHALQWYHYGQLQLGNLKGATWALDEALATMAEFPTQRVRNGTMRMYARHILETEEWADFDHAMLTKEDRNHSALHFVAGLSAANTGDMKTSKDALKTVQAVKERFAKSDSMAYTAKIVAVEENELKAAIALASGDKAAAEQYMLAATHAESLLNAPSGPPLPMKPAFEMYGEFLLNEGRYEEAAAQFKQALERTPNRTKSVRGLERATAQPRDTAALQ